MTVHGYVTHARQNRRFTAWLVAGYLASFQLLGAFALTVFLLIFDHRNTLITNPGGYAVRYALPLALLSALLFWRMYRGHADFVMRGLDIRLVTRAQEPRFIAIAEAQCTALGVRCPRFGLIETSEPNALTVGEGPARGLIAVTRGLLDQLDDDELAAIIAHEASHIRQGDTKILAANHALMRTAVIFQTHNPLRIEDWRQLAIALILPPFLPLMLAGSAATSLSMGLARFSRRGLKLGRDHIADGEAVRVTHHPDALIDALRKVGGRGAFAGSYALEGLLFDAPHDREGGRRAPIQDRIAAIAALGRPMMDPTRQRRDTRVRRTSLRPAFGRNYAAAASLPFALDGSGRPIEEPPTPTLAMLGLFLTDRRAFWRWQHACIAWQEWRIDDRRNVIGLTPRMIIPVAALTMFLIVFHWPADNDLAKLGATFDPTALLMLGEMMNEGTFCSGPSCEGVQGSAAPVRKPAPVPGSSLNSGAPDFGATMIPFFLVIVLFVGAFRPDLLRKLFGIRR